jgi:hypothetical protein
MKPKPFDYSVEERGCEGNINELHRWMLELASKYNPSGFFFFFFVGNITHAKSIK